MHVSSTELMNGFCQILVLEFYTKSCQKKFILFCVLLYMKLSILCNNPGRMAQSVQPLGWGLQGQAGVRDPSVLQNAQTAFGAPQSRIYSVPGLTGKVTGAST